MRRGQGSTRKVRSDKKYDVKPTVSSFVKEDLYHYAHIIEQPVKDAVEGLIIDGLRSDVILLQFQPIMISNFQVDNRLYIGNKTRSSKILYRGMTGKVTTRLSHDIFEELRRLAFSIGHSHTSTAALMIRKTLYDFYFMEYFTEYKLRHLKDSKKRELERFLRNIRSNVATLTRR